jgi:dextranase
MLASLVLISAGALAGADLRITDIVTAKARYAPGEPAEVEVRLEGAAARKLTVAVTLEDRGRVVAAERAAAASGPAVKVTLHPPAVDYRGYRLVARVLDASGKELARGASALDVSSDWSRFPRYGYLAHFEENVPAAAWVEEMNRFHINGLQFYDVQYKHHLPSAPGAPAAWPDVAGRPTSRATVLALLREAKARNMTTMLYNASYAAYAGAFRDGSGVKLEWAAWPDKDSPRTEAAVKALQMPGGWATPRLLYMNQQSPAWQQYIFARMADAFREFPYDGWHIDTYGEGGAWAWDGSYIDYVAGLPDYVNKARAAVAKPVVVNTVGGHGQAAMARSRAEFVYSELWPDDHATYRSILDAADEIGAANRQRAIVFAAYVHRGLAGELGREAKMQFNGPGVLLADAVMFASGASHIELGDGGRMLSHPYFVADTVITLTDDVRAKLRRYYDFLVAYQNYLRDGVEPGSFRVSLAGVAHSLDGRAGAVWSIARQKGGYSVVHLINLSGVKNTSWRDDAADYPEPPVLKDVRVRIALAGGIEEAGWASPDCDNGQWHAVAAAPARDAKDFEVTIPELSYWTTIIIRRTH